MRGDKEVVEVVEVLEVLEVLEVVEVVKVLEVGILDKRVLRAPVFRSLRAPQERSNLDPSLCSGQGSLRRAMAAS